uniref:NADH-ubiquinone oxidoreductase chain 2 n=1 Tax=Tetraphleps aterrimus TaxID=452413 RepID=A0A4D6P2D8_9HEMI|nr:NADH dehydrogenase subunit 2 [Tetraphleps aterrimus]QCE31835.1 NADH dehydrogenase subunit 2 [Tetraphleps aterrimus]
MKHSNYIMFSLVLILSSIMVISSTSWMTMWMGLEMNMMVFIPMIHETKNIKSSNSCMIYFLNQSMGSMIFLFCISWKTMYMKNTEMIIDNMMMISMMIKMGIPPFHFWFPQMMSNMSWMNCLIMMTWQKMAPMFIMSNINSKYIMIIAMMATIVGAIGGLNQTSLRKIMAYSSINHMGWMMMCMKYNNNMWLIYLIMYSIMSTMVVIAFNNKSMMFINQMQNNKTMMEKINLMLLMMSLGGMPPMMGFAMKWMVIQNMMNSTNYMMLVMMLMVSLLTLFYYMRTMSTMMMINMTMSKWNMKSNKNYKLTFLMTMNFMMPMMTMLL